MNYLEEKSTLVERLAELNVTPNIDCLA